MRRLFYILTVSLLVVWGGLVLLSWLLSATMTAGVHSLLSTEGVRWFFAHLVDGLRSPLLAWLLLGAIAGGCVWHSRLLADEENIRRNRALKVAALLAVGYFLVVVLLTSIPHALLLSATGHLWPSPFSRALVPIVCFGAVLCAVGYGLAARTFTAISHIVDAMVSGISHAAPLFFLYAILILFVHSCHYVFF